MENQESIVSKTEIEPKESKELKRLRKENMKLKEENMILKKFAAVLAKEKELD